MGLTGGGRFTWEFCDPGLLMALCIQEIPMLQDIYARLANDRVIDMDHPLSLIVAFDEFTPGAK